ncbi:12618_t:CDS:2 [Entrophospora sp. SA101]|nr:12618_t:CDS:2 [Entrophospora sp. SA101]
MAHLKNKDHLNHSGGVYLNDPNQYNSNTAATSFTSLATTPLTASHNLRNGGGVGGGDGSRAKLGGSNRNRLNEIFEEPINIKDEVLIILVLVLAVADDEEEEAIDDDLFFNAEGITTDNHLDYEEDMYDDYGLMKANH